MLRRSATKVIHSLQESVCTQRGWAVSVPALGNSLCAAQARQNSSAASPGQHPDPFTAQLQRRTEDDLRALLEKRTTTEEEPAADEEDAEEEVCEFGIMLSHNK